MAIGQLTVGVAANTVKAIGELTKFRKSVKTLHRPIDATSKKLKAFAIGLASSVAAHATISGLRQTADELDRTAKVSAKLGIAAENLSGLRFAAEQTGVAAGTLDMALQRMVRRVGEAANGTGEAVGALDELGLSAARLNSLSPDKQFSAIAGAMSRVNGQSDKVRLAFKLFDSEGVSLVNTLKLGERGLKGMQREAEKLGSAISGDKLKKVEKFSDEMSRLDKLVGGLKSEIVINIAPAAAKGVSALQEAIRGVQLLKGDASKPGALNSGLSIAKKAVTANPIAKAFRGIQGASKFVADRTIARAGPNSTEGASPARLAELAKQGTRGPNELPKLAKVAGQKGLISLFKKSQDSLQKAAGDLSGTAFKLNSQGVSGLSGFFEGVKSQVLKTAAFGVPGRRASDMAGVAAGVKQTGFKQENAMLMAGTKEATLAARGGTSNDKQKKIANATERAAKLLEKVAENTKPQTIPVAGLTG